MNPEHHTFYRQVFGGGLYSAHWTGFLHLTNAGLYGFGTISDHGSEIRINGRRVVDNHEQQWYDWQEFWCHLGAGYHTIDINFYDAQNFSGIIAGSSNPHADYEYCQPPLTGDHRP